MDCNGIYQLQRAQTQLLIVFSDTSFFPDCILPWERSFKASSLWLYSSLVKYFPSFSSSSISCLMRWKMKDWWFPYFLFLYFISFDHIRECTELKAVVYILFPAGNENPDSFDVRVHAWITHAWSVMNDALWVYMWVKWYISHALYLSLVSTLLTSSRFQGSLLNTSE